MGVEDCAADPAETFANIHFDLTRLDHVEHERRTVKRGNLDRVGLACNPDTWISKPRHRVVDRDKVVHIRVSHEGGLGAGLDLGGPFRHWCVDVCLFLAIRAVGF